MRSIKYSLPTLHHLPSPVPALYERTNLLLRQTFTLPLPPLYYHLPTMYYSPISELRFCKTPICIPFSTPLILSTSTLQPVTAYLILPLPSHPTPLLCFTFWVHTPFHFPVHFQCQFCNHQTVETSPIAPINTHTLIFLQIPH